MIENVNGDVLECGADIVVQQCNAVSKKSHGLSAEIAKRLPYADLYSQRTTRRDDIGRAVLCKPPKKDASRPIVACVIAQVAPGKPGDWCKPYNIDPLTDTSAKRLQMFRSGLSDLLSQLPDCEEVTTIAFPDHIGCGLAGGDWSTYLAEIKEFAQKVSPRYSIKICKKQ